MTTVKDVARLAGVSLMTVSRALNQPEKLSPETYQRVRQAIDELQFVPSMSARKIRGEISQGMVLAASDMKPGGSGTDDPAGRDVVLLAIDKPVKPGSVVS